MIDKIDHMKNLHALVRGLNRVDDNTPFSTHDVCTEFVKKLTDYFSILLINSRYQFTVWWITID